MTIVPTAVGLVYGNYHKSTLGGFNVFGGTVLNFIPYNKIVNKVKNYVQRHLSKHLPSFLL